MFTNDSYYQSRDRPPGDVLAATHLLAAVLQRAVRDVISYADSPIASHRRLAEEAWEWFWDDADERYLMSYAGLCSALDLDAGRVRGRVAEMVGDRIHQPS